MDNGPTANQSDPEEDDQSNASSDDANMSDGAERKSIRFTQYSLSSSVVPRSESTYIAEYLYCLLVGRVAMYPLNTVLYCRCNLVYDYHAVECMLV